MNKMPFIFDVECWLDDISADRKTLVNMCEELKDGNTSMYAVNHQIFKIFSKEITLLNIIQIMMDDMNN